MSGKKTLASGVAVGEGDSVAVAVAVSVAVGHGVGEGAGWYTQPASNVPATDKARPRAVALPHDH